MSKNLIITIVLVIVAAGAGFFGGTVYQKGQSSVRNNALRGQFAARSGGAGGQAYHGQILNTDNTGITIKLNDGSSKIIIVGSTATVVKSDPAKLTDLKSGDQVTVFGTVNSDGSINATMVQSGNTPALGSRPSPTP